MATYIVEFTALVFRSEDEVEADNPQAAREKFLAENPGIANGNGRVVSIRLKGEDVKGDFQNRRQTCNE